jgi:hypothetical protein
MKLVLNNQKDIIINIYRFTEAAKIYLWTDNVGKNQKI